jgi:hypothetical protein
MNDAYKSRLEMVKSKKFISTLSKHRAKVYGK